MNRKWKILIIVFTTIIIIIGSSIGIKYLLDQLAEEPPQNDPAEAPILLFPVENTDVLVAIAAFVWDNDSGFLHNGIDFYINDTATIVASCNMTCNGKNLFYNELGDHWQAGASFDINEDYELFIAFESFAENETFGNIQLDAILVEAGQEVTQGEVIGNLLLHRGGAHIHFMLHKNFEPVCPYLYFSEGAKTIFDALWNQIGLENNPCNGTSLLCSH